MNLLFTNFLKSFIVPILGNYLEKLAKLNAKMGNVQLFNCANGKSLGTELTF